MKKEEKKMKKKEELENNSEQIISSVEEKNDVVNDSEISKESENAIENNNSQINSETESLNNEKEINNENSNNKNEKPSRKAEFIEFLKFLCFSLSAGAIQLGSFTLMYELIGWKEWWACHLISLTLSVVWNFTFNRKFTFKSASNVPLAMTFAFLFYVGFTPASIFGGNALKDIGWNGTLVEMLMMVINFVLEFVWDKFIVFNDKLMGKIGNKLKIKKKSKENSK